MSYVAHFIMREQIDCDVLSYDKIANKMSRVSLKFSV